MNVNNDSPGAKTAAGGLNLHDQLLHKAIDPAASAALNSPGEGLESPPDPSKSSPLATPGAGLAYTPPKRSVQTNEGWKSEKKEEGEVSVVRRINLNIQRHMIQIIISTDKNSHQIQSNSILCFAYQNSRS